MSCFRSIVSNHFARYQKHQIKSDLLVKHSTDTNSRSTRITIQHKTNRLVQVVSRLSWQNEHSVPIVPVDLEKNEHVDAYLQTRADPELTGRAACNVIDASSNVSQQPR
jgi:hypothetical protein